MFGFNMLLMAVLDRGREQFDEQTGWKAALTVGQFF
jgi:hypothetical protein